MNKNIYIILLISLLTGLSDLFAQNNTLGQDYLKKSHEIEWLGQIPDPDKSEKISLWQRLGELIIGKKDISASRPVAIISAEADIKLILSQENGRIIRTDKARFSYLNDKNSCKEIFPSLISGCSIGSLGILVSDSADDMIYRIDNEGLISEFCAKDILQRPTGICYSSQTKTVWVAESGAHRLSAFDLKGNLIRHIGERGTGPGQFNFPGHICIDKEGLLYIVDAMNFRIQVLDSSGKHLSSFGKHGDASGSFSRPKGIAVDSSGNIYIADALSNRVQIFNKDGDFLYYFGGKGSDRGEFLMPAGISIDKNDYIYVSDSYNNRIQVFKAVKK